MDRWSVIRQVAARVLADYEVKAGRPAFSAEYGSHVLLTRIADTCFGLAVTPDPDLDEQRIGHLDEFLGITYWPGLTDEQRAFTIAHEIAHQALGHPPREEPEPRADFDDMVSASALRGQDGVRPAYDSRDCYELEANVFAAELLAPVRLVRERIIAKPEWTLAGLATYFGLSRDAMSNQLATALLPGPVDDEGGDEPSQPPLDDEQSAAAAVRGSSALVIAGPGAGKTRVLTERYRFLVEDCDAKPRQILCLTFANKAADEMRTRLARLLPEHAHEIHVSTFHSLGLQLLTSYGRYIGLPDRFRVATDVDAFALLRNRLHRLHLRRFEELSTSTHNVRLLLGAIGQAKNDLMAPEEYARAVSHWRADVDGMPPPHTKKALSERDALLETLDKFEDVADVYSHYQSWLSEEGLVDYGDLLMESVRLFEGDSVTLDIHARYQHILVDEFQDINYASGRLLRLLDGGRQVTWAVGDPKQGIFRFQGSSSLNLSAFTRDYPGGRVLSLRNNYRSVADILSVSGAVPFPGQDSFPELFPEDLVAARTQGEGGSPAVCVARAASITDEHSWITGEISSLRQSGRACGDIAVLCREREQAQAISAFLEARGIPTDWAGLLQKSPLFKDMMAVLGLAAGDPKSLVRLAEIPEHSLSETDVRVLVRGAGRLRSLARCLYAARDGELGGLSEEGRTRATEILRLYQCLYNRPTPWSVLTAYLFEIAQWSRELLNDETAAGIRARVTLGQIANLVRDFRTRSGIAGGGGPSDFLRYATLAIESGRLDTPAIQSAATDAVHVVTMHGSKGLQWPVVFVPHLMGDTWKRAGGELPPPPFLPREKDPLDSEGMEASSLLYVAMTRAEDRLFLSAPGRAEGEPPSSPLLAHVVKKLAGKPVITFVNVSSSVEAGVEIADSAASVPPPSTSRMREYAPYDFDDSIPHTALHAFNDCGLKFLYRYVYRLDDGDNTLRLYHRVLLKVMRNIADARKRGEPLSDASISEEFADLWAKVLGEEDRTSRYATQGVHILLNFRERLARANDIIVGHTANFVVNGVNISLRIDEMFDDGSRWHVSKHFLTRREKRHTKDGFFLGLQIANQSMNLRMPRMNIMYPMSPGQDDMSVVMPLPMYRVAEHERILGAAINDVRRGVFSSNPSPFKCRQCAYNLICSDG